MTASEIRSLFLQFFSQRGHTVVPSASLVPERDPSLLFTNAGMVQFKSVFLGETPSAYPRAASSQKCIRAGGKHNDLENVGQTARHHTFFEMLGNFSFGDYFKEDAIAYAWELLTQHYRLPAEKLWITVYRDDDEAADLWKKIVPADRVIRLGEKDNFWQMGDVGPCGPCSEILFDQGEAVHADCPGIGHCECDRYLEIWNLVFMQYSRDASGTLTPLPKPSIDTGMGLERITAICQGVFSNYETDLFQPLFRAIAELTERTEEAVRQSFPGRVIADHIRAMTFLAADGVVPSNEGRGYLFRRILRRAARFGRQFGLKTPFLHRLTGAVIDTMSAPYPELQGHRQAINDLVLGEEERFIHTLNQGVQLLDDVIDGLKKKGESIIPGESLFTLYDTYGFPIDLTEEIALESGMTLDMAGFDQAMSVQKERARRSWAGADSSAQVAKSDPIYKELLERHGPTDFVGYDRLAQESPLLAIVKDGALVSQAEEGESVALLLASTPYYAESGGQVGDQGTISCPKGRFVVDGTEAVLPGLFVHRGRVAQGMIAVEQSCRAEVDAALRQDTARNHTGTHLLHAALRKVLGDHVKQAGSLVTPDRLRFDFQHFAPLSAREIDRIETEVNAQIFEGSAVETEVLPMQEAVNSGAMALFGEKYGDAVRVVSVGDFSRELCGGTHCRAAGEIGFLKIIKEGSVAAGVRRIEALTGPAAYRWVKAQETVLREVSGLFGVRPEDVPERAERVLAQLKEKDRELAQLQSGQGASGAKSLAEVRQVGPVSFVSEKIAPTEIKGVRAHADRLRDRIQSGIIIVGAASPGGEKVSIVVMVTPEWTARYPAVKIVQALSPFIEGSGGGKAALAQAGGKRADKLNFALEQAIDIIEKM